ncbi:hypothetical protein QR685DRAFT_180390 [Neurospora intermedia]|uniref:Uncharacterized protein n=1 Tax=Neurospora intermedia TaxID=5142 RepID=A0ABR3DLR8_NEUIN
MNGESKTKIFILYVLRTDTQFAKSNTTYQNNGKESKTIQTVTVLSGDREACILNHDVLEQSIGIWYTPSQKDI